MERLVALFVAVLFALASCADQNTTAPPTGEATPTPTPLPGGDQLACANPEGFEISYPESWETNDGSVVPVCSQFNREPFEVRSGTDARVAAITAFIDPVPFHEAAASDDVRDADRAATVIDGLQAVRVSYTSGRGAFYPEGTPVTTYMIDLSPGVDEDERTLFLDTVGVGEFDHDANRVILDRMARTIDVTLEGSDPVVARYEGGGGGFTVVGEVVDDEACLRIPPNGEPACAPVPEAKDVRTIQLIDLRDELFAGVAGAEVAEVTVERVDGETSTYLPAPIEDSDLRGFAFTFDVDEVDTFTWYDVAGNRLGSGSP